MALKTACVKSLLGRFNESSHQNGIEPTEQKSNAMLENSIEQFVQILCKVELRTCLKMLCHQSKPTFKGGPFLLASLPTLLGQAVAL